jgi:hypothetical protein
MFNCYVCQGDINLEKYENNEGPREEHWSYICHRPKEDGTIEYRHLWHGVPGITRAAGGGGGFVGYAQTLADATKRALYYLQDNPYAAPEVLAGEQMVLKAVNFEENVNA